jgi:aminopeptidase N
MRDHTERRPPPCAPMLTGGPTMKDPRPQPIYRKDYRPPDYLVDAVHLHVQLHETFALVDATLHVRRRPGADAAAPLVLDGEALELLAIDLDGTPLAPDAYTRDDRELTIAAVPERFVLHTQVRIDPASNTELSGLYLSGDTYCTQCEAEGFRRITYFPDRPDVMARYATRIEADRARCPVLLSNGNRIEHGELPEGRHFVVWEDPFPKPSYLFALVAADLRCHAGTFTTASGRDVRLEIWVEPANIDSCEHALLSLQKAMKWDEERFGREYDLDIYMIVAVGDFNFAAMENKGLNIFNAKYVLARPDSATDEDYEDIEGVIAHEYFHNWTGNRVTCRDWFQLTLKEGLTVYRDESFTADMTSPAVKRIHDVRLLRTSQFAEDRSPNAHPIRPESYIEMNNFYTVTVYNKGAEVVRMYETLLSRDGFRRGMDLYFQRHDGQAVTCDDFRAAMADANGVDLEQFGRWYTQAGTPVVHAEGTWHEAEREYVLTLRQEAPQVLHVPVAVGLVGPEGRDLELHCTDRGVRVEGSTAICELREASTTFTFEDVDVRPVPSLLRGFSAPVKLQIERSRDELQFLAAHDADPFNRWDAGQTLASSVMLEQVAARSAGRPIEVPEGLVAAFGRVLADPELDGSLKALMLSLPDERVLGQEMHPVDVDGLFEVRQALRTALADAHAAAWRRVFDATAPHGTYASDRASIARRRLHHTALGYLAHRSGADAQREATELARALYDRADNMTDRQAALVRLVEAGDPARSGALDDFYARFRHDPLVIDKWFSVQALSTRPDALDRVRALTAHPDFTLRNPNRARSLLGVFSVRNQVRFHAADGGGYRLLADKILELDRINPQVAARLVGALGHWRHFDSPRHDRMREALERIVGTQGLSRDVYELASKALA